MALFALGQVVVTATLNEWAAENSVSLHSLIHRHAHGDWGQVGEQDAASNRRAIKEGARIFSVYVIEGQKIYCITEYNRTLTTLMFASEY